MTFVSSVLLITLVHLQAIPLPIAHKHLLHIATLMCTPGFTFHSPLSDSIDPPRPRHHECHARHTDYPGLNPGFVQQPGNQDSRVNLPLRGSQVPLVPPPVQPARPYRATDRSMVMETPDLWMEPILNATQALSSSLAPYSNMSSPPYVAPPSSVTSPSYMATPFSMASPFSPVSRHAEASCTAELDETIRHVLAGGTSSDFILSAVKTHKDSKDAGIHRALDTMSVIQPEVLAARINAIRQWTKVRSVLLR
jgi:hypothetical protein